MFTQSVRRGWAAMFKPTARLEPQFPWDLRKTAKTYGIALLYYFAGTFIPALLLFGGLWVAVQLSTGFTLWLTQGQVLTDLMVAATIITFLTGFGAELWYLNHKMSGAGMSLRKLVGLNLDKLGGSVWAVIWRAVLAYGIIMALDPLVNLLPLPAASDPAANFLGSLSGWAFAAVVVLIVSGPVFEELIFRGFLYNSVRSSLWKSGKLRADLVALVVSAAAFAFLHFNPSGFIAYFIAGAVLAESYRRSGSLYVPILAHVLNNATAVVILLLSLH